jgi:hypothetical protein
MWAMIRANRSYAGTDAVAGLAACFLAGTVSSLTAALITTRIDDDKMGLHCGKYVLIEPEDDDDEDDEGEEVGKVKKTKTAIGTRNLPMKMTTTMT